MNNKTRIALSLFLGITIALYFGCEKDLPITSYKTQNVFIIVVDGARYTETWGNPTHQFIPHLSALLNKGVFCSQFYNNGTTSTVPGHTAMCTGVYENILNNGMQLPTNPSIFQYWLQTFERPNSEAWVISTKDKLAVLGDCANPNWKGIFNPSIDCGNNGLFTGYREDSITFKNMKSIALNNNVRLAIVNFKQPDASGHAADSLAYLQGILDTDNYIYQFWNLLQSNSFYKDRTTLIVTNDRQYVVHGHFGWARMAW